MTHKSKKLLEALQRHVATAGEADKQAFRVFMQMRRGEIGFRQYKELSRELFEPLVDSMLQVWMAAWAFVPQLDSDCRLKLAASLKKLDPRHGYPTDRWDSWVDAEAVREACDTVRVLGDAVDNQSPPGAVMAEKMGLAMPDMAAVVVEASPGITIQELQDLFGVSKATVYSSKGPWAKVRAKLVKRADRPHKGGRIKGRPINEPFSYDEDTDN